MLARTLSLTRYEDDDSAPSAREFLRDLALRALLPAAGLWLLVVGLGLIVVGPLGGLQGETTVNRSLQSMQSPVLDNVTMVWSRIGNTETVIAVCVVMVAVIWWRSRQWWWAVIPAIAISVQATVFVLATTLVGRDRPPVPHLDPAPPTSSYPSGHVGASTALYLTLALMAHRIGNPVLRRLVVVICLVLPFLVAFARLYRGMHHLSDVVVGFVDGVVCGLLAWFYLRRDAAASDVPVKT